MTIERGDVNGNGRWPHSPVVPLMLGVDVWVYLDARRRTERGAPVVFRAGSIAIQSPAVWLVGCLLLWMFFFPLCVVSRT